MIDRKIYMEKKILVSSDVKQYSKKIITHLPYMYYSYILECMYMNTKNEMDLSRATMWNTIFFIKKIFTPSIIGSSCIIKTTRNIL